MNIEADKICTPYVYIVKFKPTGQLYIGSRTAKNCHPRDLWVKYFTSSVHVKKLLNEHGSHSFSVRIIKVFSDRLEARQYESTILKKCDAAKSVRFLNRSNGDGNFICTGHTEETKKKLSVLGKGKSKSELMKSRLSTTNKNRKCAEETKEKISIKAKTRVRHKWGHHTEEGKRNISMSKKGIPIGPSPKKGKKYGPHSEESKRNRPVSSKKGVPRDRAIVDKITASNALRHQEKQKLKELHRLLSIQ